MPSDDYQASKEVAEANFAFYRAFQGLNIVEMRDLWHASPEAQCIHPGSGLLRGYPAVIDSFVSIFTNTESIRFEISDLNISMLDDCGWVTCIENVRGTANANEGQMSAIATNLFVRAESTWKLALHHASVIGQKPRS